MIKYIFRENTRQKVTSSENTKRERKSKRRKLHGETSREDIRCDAVSGRTQTRKGFFRSDYEILDTSHKKPYIGVIFIMLPILLCPLLVPGVAWDETDDPSNKDKSIAQFAYCLITMACFWIFEVLPISVTALLPYILFPSLGLMSSSAVAAKYMSNTNLLLVGGFMVAIAIEETGLHKVSVSSFRQLFALHRFMWFVAHCIGGIEDCWLEPAVSYVWFYRRHMVLVNVHCKYKHSRLNDPNCTISTGGVARRFVRSSMKTIIRENLNLLYAIYNASVIGRLLTQCGYWPVLMILT